METTVTAGSAPPRKIPWWRIGAWQVLEAGDSGWSLIVYTTYFSIFVQEVLHKSAVAYGTAATIGGLAIALLSPLLGAVTDIGGRRQPYLRFFALGTVFLTALIGFSRSYPLAVTFFVLAYVFTNATFSIWNSMLPAVSNEKNVSTVVGVAVGIGYLSNIVVQLGMAKVADTGYVNVFFTIAVIYLIYTLPAMTVAPDFAPTSANKLDIGGAYARVVSTLREARRHKALFRFLIGDFLYENAVASVIALMVVYARNVMGFQTKDLPVLFGPALVIAGLSAMAFGWVIRRTGPKKIILLDLAVWLVLFASIIFINDKTLFIAVAGPLTGIGLAGVWSSSRVMLTALTPSEKAGEFWGLYNLSGRTASVIGDATWTTVLLLVGETVFGYKVAIASLGVFVLLGAVLILGLPDARPSAANVINH